MFSWTSKIRRSVLRHRSRGVATSPAAAIRRLRSLHRNMMILVTICGHDDVYKAIVHQVRRTIRQMTYKTFSALIR
jgi:hypothetical protein